MTDYKPVRFKRLYETQQGQDLWKFLTREDNIIRMETASELKRPAVEGVAIHLEKNYGPKLGFTKDFHRGKQMVGHMVRQIMEKRGFILDQQNVVVRVNKLFARASRYKRWPPPGSDN